MGSNLDEEGREAFSGTVVQEFEDRQKGGAKNATGATKRKRPLEAARGIVRPPKKSK